MVYLINNRNEAKHEKKAFLGPFEITDINYQRKNAEIYHEKLHKVVNLDLLKRAHIALLPGNIVEKPNKDNFSI